LHPHRAGVELSRRFSKGLGYSFRRNGRTAAAAPTD